MGRPNFEVQGIAEAKGNSLLTSLEHMTGGKVGYLYDHYLPDQKPDPLSLVVSEEDSHPNPKGNRVLVDAIVDALKDAPPTKHLFE